MQQVYTIADNFSTRLKILAECILPFWVNEVDTGRQCVHHILRNCYLHEHGVCTSPVSIQVLDEISVSQVPWTGT